MSAGPWLLLKPNASTPERRRHVEEYAVQTIRLNQMLITVEHAWPQPARQQIVELRSAQGYERNHTLLSRFDDW